MITPMLLLFFALFSLLHAEPLDLKISGKHAILMNADTGAILFEKNSQEQCYPASTTKIATAIYALHLREHDLMCTMVTRPEAIRSITPAAKVQSKYRSPPHWLESDSSHIGLKKGEEMPLRDLLHAVLIASANDASNVVAENLGGTIPTFMEHLNHYLKSIGCKNTHYNNPHGLTHPEHFTTAEDLAIMAKEALKSPFFCEVMSKTRYTCPETNLEYERFFVQTNHLLREGARFYPHAIGMKTGTTQAAGKNLVAVAEQHGRRLIGVFMGYKTAGDLYSEARTAFETAFQETRMKRTLLSSGPQKFTKAVPGASKQIQGFLAEDLSYEYFPSEGEGFRLFVHWKPPKLPIASGDEVGRVEVIDRWHNIQKAIPVYAFNDVKPTLWHRLIAQKKILFALAVIPFLIIAFRIRRYSQFN